MAVSIHKFEEDMLHGEPIYINRNTEQNWSKKHWHNYFEIIYHKGCSGHCILNSERCEITEACLFLLTPKDFHEIFTSGSDDSYSLIIAFNERIIDKSILAAITEGPFMISEVSSRLADSLEELHEVFLSNAEYREHYVAHLFNSILFRILESANAITSLDREINPMVRESISLMLKEPSGDFTLDFFAKRFNVTSAYFSRLFHRCAGISFKQYLTSLRLEYAKQLLDERSMPVIDVSYECGFNTPSQFFRAFKTAFGIAPSAYRRRRRS